MSNTIETPKVNLEARTMYTRCGDDEYLTINFIFSIGKFSSTMSLVKVDRFWSKVNDKSLSAEERIKICTPDIKRWSEFTRALCDEVKFPKIHLIFQNEGSWENGDLKKTAIIVNDNIVQFQFHVNNDHGFMEMPRKDCVKAFDTLIVNYRAVEQNLGKRY